MAYKNSHCIYDNNHNLQIYCKNNLTESRYLNINIIDCNDYLQIKLRDSSDFLFNYTTCVGSRQFEQIRCEQSLDIDFNEFRSNLVDMLQQVHNHEMFLKVEMEGNEQNAKLIFYGKSKIKALIFLTLDFQLTNKKEIFDEMYENIVELQRVNKNLTSQLQTSKCRLQDKEVEIGKFSKLNKQLEDQFRKELENLSFVFSSKLQECSAILLHKILILTQKLLKLIKDVDVVKTENHLKSESSARLLHSMENLRLESIETSRIVNDLKRENCNLKSIQLSNEKLIGDLNSAIQRQEMELQELKKQRDEFEKDAKQGALIIAQKSTANEELARDVVKANQMLVSFNHLLETKNQEIEKLKQTINNQEQTIQEQNHRFHGLCQEYEDYRAEFNLENMNKISQDLFAANRKVEEIEKVNRETAKLNELLTRKLASGDFMYTH